MASNIRLTQEAWRRVWMVTALIMGASVLISNVATIAILLMLGTGIVPAGIIAATVLPLLIGGPMMFYQAMRQQQLRLANEQLDILASTDWLTDTLNRRAFTANASTLLAPGGQSGTLLVVDADHFKAVNDRFGHEAGDEALQLLARTLCAIVRSCDLVGRLGGEEFGVFLADADFDTALGAATRIREAIAALDFAPLGTPHPLSVSIGGATATQHSRFAELFRIADHQLYRAKADGRNRINLVRMPPSIEPPANSNRPVARVDKTADIGL